MKKNMKQRMGALVLTGALAAGMMPSALAVSKTTGYENGTNTLDMTQIGRYDAGMSNPDGGVMEIVDYNSKNGYAYAINGQTGKLAAISLAGLEQKGKVETLSGKEIDVKALVEEDGFVYGDMTSVAVSPDGTMLAAAIQAQGTNDDGRVALFQCEEDGSLTFQKTVTVGKQPDMVTFTPDGTRILTANEGEPREGYGQDVADPAGSVTMIDTKTGTPVTVGFEAYDDQEQRSALTKAGVVLKKDTAPSVDFEPEYIACTNTTAYVTLQEANAVAVLDLDSNTYTGIYSAGFEDYSKVAVDIDKKDDSYSPKTYEGLKGIRMPDGIALYTVDGVDYLLTANEGDAREWGEEDSENFYLNEKEVNFGDEGAVSPAGNITGEESGLTGKVVFYDTQDVDGLEENTDYLFGGRSFTLYQVEEDGLKEVYTSGSDFEAKTAEYLPEYFNCSNDSIERDDRSGKKGPEAETVTVGQVEGKTYAFVTLERTGGIMAYDITDPSHITYANYMNSRDYDAFDEEQGIMGADNSPEGLKFISAEKSPVENPLLLAACEVGGTVAAYALGQQPEVELPFTDVKEDQWFYDGVRYVYEEGMMDGMGNDQFQPDTGVSRAMVWTVLARLDGVDTEGGENWYAKAQQWAMEKGISDGTMAEDSVTREQLVTMLYRYADNPEATGDLAGYPDADQVNQWAKEAMVWGLQTKLINGMDGKLNPQGGATRGQLATMLMRFCQDGTK
jgi:hypothetical protein